KRPIVVWRIASRRPIPTDNLSRWWGAGSLPTPRILMNLMPSWKQPGSIHSPLSFSRPAITIRDLQLSFELGGIDAFAKRATKLVPRRAGAPLAVGAPGGQGRYNALVQIDRRFREPIRQLTKPRFC